MSSAQRFKQWRASTHSDQVQKVVGLVTNEQSAVFLVQQNRAGRARFARYQKKLFYQTEDNSSDTQRLKNCNYLAASSNYWGKRDFLQGKAGSFIFLIANLFLNKLKKFKSFYLRKNYLFNDIKFKQLLFIVNGEILIKYCLIVKKSIL